MWSNDYDCCVWCLTTDREHVENGLCARCYRHIFEPDSFKSRRRWKKRDIQLVMLHKIPDKDLSKLIHRTVKAIQSKRNAVKMSKLQ